MPEETFLQLVGANPAGTVLDNLQTAPPAVKKTLSDALNAALKAKLSATLTNANLPALAGLVEKMPAIDVAAAKDQSIQAFAKQQMASLAGNDPATKQAVDAEIPKLPDATTIGTLLELNTPLQKHPVFQADVRKANIASLLATSPTVGSNQQLQSDFISRYAASASSTPDFWKQLNDDPKFKAAVPELQFTLQLGTLTQNNATLAAALRQQYQPKSPRDLTKLTADDWNQLIKTKNIPIPNSVSGAAPAEKIANYVAQMLKSLQAQFPTDYIAQGLAKSTDTIDQKVAQFLKESPDFSLVTTHLDKYIAKNQPESARIAADKNQVISRTRAYQRLARLDSDFHVVSTLMANGLDSAHKIASTPRRAFLLQHAQALGGTARAEAVYDTSQRTTAAALNLYMTVREGFNGPHPRVFGDVSKEVAAAVQQIPNWQELFGSTSSCACEDCRSVLGDAAYLADLLHFLSNKQTDPNNKNSPTLYDILSERRPDLANIKLNCENTDTTLPYLDLVNEILESVVISRAGESPSPPAHNTPANATSDELIVNPENTNDAAYKPLETAFYPFTLPFDRFLGTARTYLEYAGSSLYEVMSTFQTGLDPVVSGNNNPYPVPSSQTIALEYLKISPNEFQILTGRPFQGTSPLTKPSHIWQTSAGGAWSNWGGLAGGITKLATAVNADGRIEVFAIGTDTTLNHIWQTSAGGTWSDWAGLAGGITELATAVNHDGRLEVFAIGTDGALNHIWQTSPGGSWSDWAVHGGGTTKLATAVNADGRLEVFAIGADRTLKHIWQTTPGWALSGWVGLAGVITELATAMNRDGRLEVFAIGTDGALSHIWQTSAGGAWSGWAGLAGGITELATAVNQDGRLEVFAIGTDGAVNHIWQTSPGGAWSSWAGLGGGITKLATAVNGDGRIEVFAIGIETSLLHIWQTSPGWYSDISSVPRFLQRTGITLEELISLVETHFLNPAQAITLQTDPQDPCNLQAMTIANLSPPDANGNVDYTVLRKVYRFIRLYKKLGWKISQLDKAITALGAAELDQTLLFKLSQIKQLQDTLNLTPMQILGLWANLDVEGPDSLYLSVFQRTGDPAFCLRYTWTLPQSTNNPPLNLSFLKPDGAQILYNSGQLQFSGNNGQPMTTNQQRFLLSLSTDSNYRQAIQALYLQNQNPANTSLSSLPSGLALPSQLPDAIYYQGNQLFFVGQMSDELRAQLKSLSTALSADPNYQRAYELAIDDLHDTRSVAGIDIALANQTLTGHANTILASLRVTAIDFTAILNELAPAPSDSQINLANLSALYRYATLAQALKLSVSDLISLKQLIGIDPFQPPSTTRPGTVEFVLKAIKVTRSKFSVARLNYICRAISNPSSGLGPQQADMDQFVSSLQSVLTAPPASADTATDPNGVLLRQYIEAVLDGSDVSPAMDLIDGSASYSTQLAALPTLTFPASFTGLISFDSTHHELAFKGLMSQDQSDQLLSLSTGANYKTAIESLFQQGQTAWITTYKSSPPSPNSLPSITFPPVFTGLIKIDQTNKIITFTGLMSAAQEAQLLALSKDPNYQAAIQSLYTQGQAAQTASYTAPLNEIPTISFPVSSLHGTITFEQAANHQLTFKGPMSDADERVLLSLSAEASYQSAIRSLYSQPRQFINETLFFLDPKGLIAALIGNIASQADKFGYVLNALLNVISAVVQTLSNNLKLDATLTKVLLGWGQGLASPALLGSAIHPRPLTFSSATLNALPPINVPSSCNGLLSFDPIHKELIFKGRMSATQKSQLLTLSPDMDYQAAVHSLFQQSANPSAAADLLAAVGNGLSVSYYSNANFSGTALPASIVPTINFEWGQNSPPAPGLDSSAFSAKWIGQILARFSETFTFYVRISPSGQAASAPPVNPSVTLTVNGKVLTLISPKSAGSGSSSTNGSGSAPSAYFEYSGTMDLVAGQLTQLELDYPNAPTLASLLLSWSGLSTPKTVIPQNQLYASSSFTFAQALAAYSLLRRIALLVNTFQMTLDDLIYLSNNSVGFQGKDPNDPTKTAPFDLIALPSDPSAYTPALFNQWERLLAFFDLRDSMPDGDAGLLAIFQAASSNPPVLNLVDPIAAATEWDKSELRLLVGSQIDPLTSQAIGFGLTSADFSDERWLVRLQACFAPMTRFGASSKQLFEWASLGSNPSGTVTTNGTTITWVSGATFKTAWAGATIYINNVACTIQSVGSSTSLTLTTSAGVQASPAPYHLPNFASVAEPSIARDIQSAVKVKYDDATWTKVGKSLNDKLRESSRNALVAYILATSGDRALDETIVTPDQLYEYFLIDVEMSSCMLTSRIVQATAAIQLFVQRCLMNLEPSVSPSAIDPTKWGWMKNYRVWQANREVFLYPENWIDPELRDDKTPFFQELQTELQENPVTADTVESALLNYLEKLDQVARLEIRGIYYEFDQNSQISQTLPDGTIDATKDVLHVFGRTLSTPYVYFYRRLLNARRYGQDNSPSIWTPWEKVNLDIQGDHLLPVVWNGHPYLLWPIFTETSDPTQPPPTSSGSATQPRKTLNIELAWSEYKQGKWLPKQLTTQNMPVTFETLPYYSGPLDKNVFSFSTGFSTTGNLIVAAWTPLWLGAWGPYQMYFPDFGINNPQYPGLQDQTSVQYVGEFDFTDCSGKITVQANPANYTGAGAVIPQNSMYDGNTILEVSTTPGDVNARTGKLTITLLDSYLQDWFPQTILTITPTQYRLACDQSGYAIHSSSGQGIAINGFQPFFYQDHQRTYFVTPQIELTTSGAKTRLKFATFWHPQVCAFIKTLNQYGVSALLSILQQGRVNDGGVVTGFTLSASSTLTPGLTVGSLYAQGKLYETPLGTEPNPGPIPSSIASQAFLFCDPSGNFYYLPSYTPQTIGDALIGSLGISSDGKSIGYVSTAIQQSTIFEGVYVPDPDNVSRAPSPEEIVDFGFDGAYSNYNWELFFHIPLLIASRLSQNQRFEEAQKWFHYIFNPTSNSTDPVPQRFWNCLPFYKCSTSDEINSSIESLLSGQASYQCGQDVQSQVSQWIADPFNPFLIARLRTIALRKTVVMKYLYNLIAWGDYLFSQNTRESINEATQLYVLAQQILGVKPVTIPSQGTIQDYCYNDLLQQGNLDEFSNVLVTLENVFPFSTGTAASTGGTGATQSLSGVATLYFCIPQNDQLLGYWDTVADRLYKIRHCMTIQGVVEQLALFAPPISPALLVRAKAMGVDLSSVLNEFSAPVPNYRFTFMLQKALDLCAEVRSLGAAFLSALEKNDAEALSALRATQEISLLQALLQIKQSQIDDANDNVAGLQASYAVTLYRQQYYQQLIAPPGISTFEQTHISELKQAQDFQGASQIVEIAGSVAALIPDFTLGASGISSPVVTAQWGGINVSQALAAASRVLSAIASLHSYHANMASIMGGWDRRSQEWNFQLQTATKELVQIQSQIDAANVRVQIAQYDLQNQQLQISNAQTILDYLNSKYTNQELYQWMISQISAAYFQCYQMAYGLAKRAESCFRFELGLADSNFIQFGYWDSLRKGLLAGEGLYTDLKRVEMAYQDQNKREYEITKYISLVLLDPIALISLKESGQCIVSLPEVLFDTDYPGHYLRRIKSVSLTIPCVTGPYTSVNCTLTLVSSKIRMDSSASSPSEDSHLMTNFAATQSVATSSAQNDSGMFELNFRDERYLPFEGAGVISTWQIQLPQDCNAFDFETISDVVINLKYTARDGGDALRAVAKQAVQQSQGNLPRVFSLRHEFPTEWYKFLHPADTDSSQNMQMALGIERFPFQYRGKKINFSQVQLLLKFKDINDAQRFNTGTPLGDFVKGSANAGSLDVYISSSPFAPGQQPQPPTWPPQNATKVTLQSTPTNFNGTPYGPTDPRTAAFSGTLAIWWLQVFTRDQANLVTGTNKNIGDVAPTLLDSNGHILADIIEDMYVMIHYSVA